jgi:hypothetical protein
VFSSVLYGFVVPLAFGAAFVIIPALSAMAEGARRRALSLRSGLMWAIAAVVFTAWLGRTVENTVSFGIRMPVAAGPDGLWGTSDDARPMRIAPLILLLPTAWTIVASVRRRTA